MIGFVIKSCLKQNIIMDGDWFSRRHMAHFKKFEKPKNGDDGYYILVREAMKSFDRNGFTRRRLWQMVRLRHQLRKMQLNEE